MSDLKTNSDAAELQRRAISRWDNEGGAPAPYKSESYLDVQEAREPLS